MRRLRAALLRVADNLVKNNRHFIGQADLWRRQCLNNLIAETVLRRRIVRGRFRTNTRCVRTQKTDERLIRVRVTKKFSRLLYVMVAGEQPVAHPCCGKRESILKKIMDFHRERATPAARTMADLNAVVVQLPQRTRSHESEFLSEHLESLSRSRKGPTALGELLPAILARLSDSKLQSHSSGDAVPNESIGR